MRAFITFFVFIFFYLCAQANSQIDFEHLDIKNGLSQNSAKCILQDADGFIWVGTEDGLNKYDGKSFKIYRHSSAIKTSLPYNFVKGILEDEQKNLWIVHSKSISCFNKITEQFEEFKIPDFKECRITCFFKSRCRKEIWLCTQKEIWKFNTTYKNFSSIPISNISDITEINAQEVVFASNYELKKIDVLTNKLAAYLNSAYKFSFVQYDENSKSIWAASESNELISINSKTKIIKDYSKLVSSKIHHTLNIVTAILVDKTKRIWVGTNNGLLFFENENATPEFYELNPIVPNSISKNYVIAFCEDHSGIIWIGTYGGGLNKVNFNKSSFNTYKNNPFNKNSVSSNFILSFFEDSEKNIWIGTDGEGLNKWITAENKFIRYPNNNKNRSSDVIFCIDQLGENLLLGTALGLELFNTSTNKFTEIPYSNINSETFIKTILICHNGKVLLGGGNGLFEFDEKKNRVVPLSISVDKIKNIRSLVEDKNGNIWIAFSSQIIKWDGHHTKVFFRTENNGENDYTMSTMILDSTGILWIGTMGNGFIRFDTHNETYKNFNISNGLANDLVYGIEKDNQNNLWISTNFGISKYSIEAQTFKNYSVLDGLQSNEFNGGANYITSNGYLLFGGVEGFNFFNPIDIKENKTKPLIRLTSFKVFDNELNIDSLLAIKLITLSYFQNYLTFNFSALEYTAPEKNIYAYKLEGYDYNWVYSGTSNIARYNSLRPGNYVLKIKGTNNDGIWSDEINAIQIIITPPFWQRWWFVLIIFLIIVCVVWVAVYLRISFIRKQEQHRTSINKQLSELELKALRAQMNPHFIFNALNSIQDFILNNNIKEASKYLSKFAKLIRQILDNSETSTITLAKKIDFLKLYIEIESLRFNNGFNYSLNIFPDVNIYKIEIPTMLIQPFIENAIWHGLMHKENDRELTVKFHLQNKELLVCEVIDNGIGRKKSREIRNKQAHSHISKGLKVTNERLAILNQLNKAQASAEIIDLYDDEGNSAGTKVIITIPFQLTI